MLSRVADNLYWMSRYIERAESITRMVEVNQSSSLEFIEDALSEFWEPVLKAICASEIFNEHTKIDIGQFLFFGSGFPNSVKNCFLYARENARMVRDQLSVEMWVELNNIYLFFQSGQAEATFLQNPQEFFQKVIKFSLVFQGLSGATIPHDEGWRFMALGTYLERADQTSRMLDTLTFQKHEPTRLDLLAVLRSCVAQTAFRRQYKGELSMTNVADYLLFSRDFPRSIRFSIRCIDENLHSLSGVPSGNFSNEAERLIGSSLAMVNFTDIKIVMSNGLHQTIDDLQRKLINVGQCIFETYVLLPFELQSAEKSTFIQAQSQQQ
ncbi:alpha-E domain-containing protein [Opitutales bacterium]|nr:alpha-E domain-containing protein [Opitutales bacterium]